eukprot:9789203-Alexandrium_andersonii.AAC.1
MRVCVSHPPPPTCFARRALPAASAMTFGGGVSTTLTSHSSKPMKSTVRLARVQRTYRVIGPSGQTWPGPQHPAREVVVPTRPTGQTAFSAARKLHKFRAPHSRAGRRSTSGARILIVGSSKFPADSEPRRHF